MSVRHAASLQPAGATLVSSLGPATLCIMAYEPYIPTGVSVFTHHQLIHICCCSICFCREPCCAALPVAFLSKAIRYQWGPSAPSYLMRQVMCQALNQNAQCACSPGAATCRGNTFPRTASSASSRLWGDTAIDDLEPVEDGDVHSRLAHITQENQAFKVQLSQLTELVWQLLPQSGQAAPQLGNIT